MSEQTTSSQTVPVLVTGGTGMLGREVVAELVRRGRTVRVLSRRTADEQSPGVRRVVGDLSTGAGLDEALDGAAAVVHCASEPRHGERDVEAAGRLLIAARRAGIEHLVYISIVGVDAIPYSYYRAKLEVEHLVEAGDVPWTILRTTQFHQFVPWLLRRFTVGGVTVLPSRTSVQPVDVREVAARLVDLVEAGPSGRVPDVGGPRVVSSDEAARVVAAAQGRRARVVHVRMPGKAFAACRAGHLLCPAQATGVVTLAEALAAD
ncbi:SDR family oxidoreductase [Cellulomonas composti]|uniref:Nucleotide-diphosphate-sugar epimerase n=1 Tax=Cellulomonas composti TaxID=266130 RepID=A0A511JE64_9CELL|nr:NAD(P)H-binding protein [Cellulomonas composti]GEL96079.1 nucleotide-diphosphate-sugar epimerase [Cellulomonas composti]